MEPILTANYHTHTARCHHAAGTDRDYVEAALTAGLKTLGFADHVPWPYPDGWTPRVRMTMDELPDYIRSILSLREEYAGRIELLIGFESEYFSSMFRAQQEIFADHPIDYLLLAQHFLDTDQDGFYVGRPFDNPRFLTKYVDQLLEGANTGAYRYICHPDLPNFTGDEAVYRREMRRLCREAKSLGLPLEVNILGLREGRQYPSRRFFELAAEEGNNLILGVDAHDPAHFSDPAVFARALDFARGFGLELLPALP